MLVYLVGSPSRITSPSQRTVFPAPRVEIQDRPPARRTAGREEPTCDGARGGWHRRPPAPQRGAADRGHEAARQYFAVQLGASDQRASGTPASIGRSQAIRFTSTTTLGSGLGARRAVPLGDPLRRSCEEAMAPLADDLPRHVQARADRIVAEAGAADAGARCHLRRMRPIRAYIYVPGLPARAALRS